MTDGAELKLGRWGKQGAIDPNKDMKAGIKREEITDAKQQSIFDKADKDHNGVLTSDEMQEFNASMKEAAGNKTLSQRESKKYLKKEGLTDLKGDDLLAFLKTTATLSQKSKIESAVKNEQGQAVLTSNDGKTVETINQDKSSVLQNYKDNERQQLDSQIEKRTDGSKLTTQYENNKKTTTEEVGVGGNPIVKTLYDENEKAKTEVLTDGTKETTSEFMADGTKRTQQIIENKGIEAKEKTSKYAYNDDGSYSVAVTENGQTTTTKYDKDGKPVADTPNNPDGNDNSQPVQNDDEQSTPHHAVHHSGAHHSRTTHAAVAHHAAKPKKQVVTGHFSDKKAHKFVKIGNTGINGRSYVRDPKTGKTYVMAHDGTILKEQYVKQTNQKVLAQRAYNNGKKIQGKFRGAHGKAVSGGSYVAVSKPDKFGRTYVVDKNGHTFAMSHDGYILKASYVNHTNFVDKVKTNKGTAQRATLATLTQQLNKAQKDFQAQLDDDGWAGDVADGVSALWGSDNRASKVRTDLQAYRNQLKALNNASKKGEAQFEATFKKMYGVNYNQQLVADYIEHPTEANYERAFGHKNNIASRVAKYNQSQKTGASVVKGVTAAAVTIGVGIATGGTSLVAEAAVMAGTSAAAGFSDRLSSHNGLKDGEATQILEDAALDGAMVFGGGQIAKFAGKAVTGLSKAAIAERAAINAAGNATMGAGVEYAQTGHVTIEGTAINAAMGTVGSLTEIGALRRAKKAVKAPEVADIHENFSPSAERGHRDFVEDHETVAKVDIKHVDAKQRKLVEDALEDSPSAAQQAQYDKDIAYKKPTAKEQKAIDKNNAEAAEAYHEQHEIGNNISQDQVDALKKAKLNMTEPDVNANGVYKNETGVFKMKNGKVTEIKTTDGRVIQDELKIAKYLDKNDINVKDLKLVKAEPKVETYSQPAEKPEYVTTENPHEIIQTKPGQEGIDNAYVIKPEDIAHSKPGKVSADAEVKAEVKPEVVAKPEVKAEVKPEVSVKPEVKAEVKPEVKVEVKPEVKAKPVVRPDVEIKADIETGLQNIDKVKFSAKLGEKWQACKKDISAIKEKLYNATTFDKAALVAKCKTVFADLKTIASNVEGKVKTQIQNLMKNLREMLESKNIINKAAEQEHVQTPISRAKNYKELSSPAERRPELDKYKINQKQHDYKLSRSEMAKVNDLSENFHPENSNIQYLRKTYPEYKNLTDEQLLNTFKLDENHAAFVKSRRDLFSRDYIERGYWNDSPLELKNNHSAWKMHICSVSEDDYQKMADVVLPYLKDHKIAHKTLSSTVSPELLGKMSPEQIGKAFTIYPASKEEMAQVSKDLDYIMRSNKLGISDSHIIGDRQMGDTGRLFYRYEFNSGKFKDNCYTPKESNKVQALYDGNRGEGKYLADDMTSADDPWFNFNPANPASKPHEMKISEIEAVDDGDIVTPQLVDRTNVIYGELPKGKIEVIASENPIKDTGLPNLNKPVQGSINQSNIVAAKKYVSHTADGVCELYSTEGLKTNISPDLQPNDVCVLGNVAGYSKLAGPRPNFDTDMRNMVFNEIKDFQKTGHYAIYNPKADATIIGVRMSDHMHRPGLLNVVLKGKVSEVDAQGLIDDLMKKKLIPTSAADLESNEIGNLGSNIQKETAEYFRASASEQVQAHISRDKIEVIDDGDIVTPQLVDGTNVIYGDLPQGKIEVIASEPHIVDRKLSRIGAQIEQSQSSKELSQLEQSLLGVKDSPEKTALLKKIKDKKVEIENDVRIVDVEEQAADYTVETDSTIDDMNNIYASAAADDAIDNGEHIFGNGDDSNFGFNDPFSDGSYTDHYYDDPGMDDGGLF